MKKKYIIGAVLLIAVLGGGKALLERMIFDPDPPKPSYPTPENLREAQLQDLDYLNFLFDLDRSYSSEALREAKALQREVQAKAGSYSSAEFELAIARIVALADNAHTNVLGFGRTAKYPRLPIRTYWFSDGLYIVRAYDGFEHLLGARIIAAAGKPLAEVEALIRPYIGGPDEYFYGFQFAYLFEFTAFLHAAGITDDPDYAALTVVMPDGVETDIIFDGDYGEVSGPVGHPYHMIYQKLLPGEEGWHNLFEGRSDIDFTLETAASFLQKRLPDLNAHYVRYWSNNDSGSYLISDYNQEVAGALDSAAPLTFIILDLRNNRGGNNALTKDIMLSLGDFLTPGGRLYIITGRDTFSAGIGSMVYALNGAKEKAIIIGTRIGDRDSYWGENNRFTLPNSEVAAFYTRGLHTYTEPCKDILKCHWGSMFSIEPVDSLNPDNVVPNLFKDYANGKDPVLAKIRELEK